MTNEVTKIKARIRALSEKTTNNGCTEHEATAAMEKIGELLEVYNLSLGEVFLADEKCIEAIVDLERKTRPSWIYIFTAVSGFTQTRCWSNGTKIHFFGFEPDVQMAVFLSDMILRTFDVEGDRFKTTDAYKNSRRRRYLSNSFRAGIAQRLSERLVRVVPKAFGNELVLAKEVMVTRELNRQKPGLQLAARYHRKSFVNADAFNAGKMAGGNMNINRPIHAEQAVGYLT